MPSWRSWTLVMSAALAVCGAAIGPGQSAPAQSAAVASWSMYQDARSFTPQNLWQYIDGAADLFLSYGFAGLGTAQYARQGASEPAITVDVYDMGTPLNAFGVFTSERWEGAPALAVGAQGYDAEGLIAFWKGRCYVKIATTESGDDGAARALAQATAERLTGTTALPDEFERLPSKGRVPGSERYVRKDALGHKALTNVISADYHVGKTTAALHVADLLKSARAAPAWTKLRDFEKRAGTGLAAAKGLGEAAFSVRDSGYGEMVVARAGRYLVIAASEHATEAALKGLVKGALAGLVEARGRQR